MAGESLVVEPMPGVLEFARDVVCFVKNRGPAYPFDPEVVGSLRKLMEEEEHR